MRLIIMIMVMTLCLACDQARSVQPSLSEAINEIESMTFARHSNGLCFGVIHYHGYDRDGISITIVPSEMCRER